ncbi:MAG TPA: HPP family protein [Leptospiraceae bacterium]|nr:HPP family protein [Leptospiraceae bacterium]HMW07585.1 HPP family protein [Leptospiraceae bacterium]HMX33037.1 HPP family protein [Leptospiraceae bacterium]HMY33200.1 HPP family protein [Leptospiraceae bacterium]HMZ65070.1 HPP family protein [Leptospiraceae bacterium]
MKKRFYDLPRKLKAPLRSHSAPLSWKYAIWSFISGTVSILAILWVTQITGYPLLIGSFGATAVLLFGVPDSALTQPRNLIGGHFISAVIAILLVQFFGSGFWVTGLSVGLSIFAMYLTRTLHPPGGATALIGVMGNCTPMFLFVPVLAGVLILFFIALFTNNFVYHRQYPKHWL